MSGNYDGINRNLMLVGIIAAVSFVVKGTTTDDTLR